MANSGPNNTWLEGTWDTLHLPVIGWKVWLADGTTRDSTNHRWPGVPNRVLGVCVYHERNRKTWMTSVDSYPSPTGRGPRKRGEQVGEVDCKVLLDIRDRMYKES